MYKKIFIGLGALTLLVVLSASVFLYYVSGWEKRAIADVLAEVEIITKNIGSIDSVILDSESNMRKVRKATIIAEGTSGQAILTGSISPTVNESEFLFRGKIKLPEKAYAIEFTYSGIVQYKGNVKYKYGEVETGFQKVNK